MAERNQNAIIRETYVLDDEINLSFILNVIIRNKYLIGSLAFASFIIFLISAILKPRIWQGSFQIVLTNKDSQPLLQGNQISLRNRLLGSSASSSTLTEVGILESQSVLMPVFDFVNSEYKKLNKTSKDLIFSNWKEDKLKINLKEDTSILNILYNDTNKESILTVLSKISKEYQKYSGKKRSNSIQSTKKYLEDQILKYKIKTSKSIKNAEEFAIAQDLIIPKTTFSSLSNGISLQSDLLANSNFLVNSLQTSNDNFLANTNIEETRVNAANKLRQIESQINKLKNLKNDNEKLSYINSILPQFRKNSLNLSLDELDKELISLESKYLPEHKSIKRLLRMKANIIDLLKAKSIDYLQAERLATEVIEESASRPKGVITRYKELMREANRDENILVQLENQLQKIYLEEAKKEEPWQLITNPTVSNRALGIGKKNTALLGLIIGSIIGLILAYLKESISGLIYEKEKIEKILDTETIYEVDLNNKESIISFKEFINQFAKRNKLINIRFIYQSLERKKLNNIKNALISENNFFLNQDTSFLLEEDDMVIFIAANNPETKKDLNSLKNKLRLLGKKISGILFIK